MVKYLTFAAALVAAVPALAQPAVSLGDGDYGSPPGFRGGGPLVDAPRPSSLPAPSYPTARGYEPVLTPYPRARAGEPQVFLPHPEPDPTEQRIKQLEQQNRLRSLEWQQRVFEDALRLPRR